MSDVTPRATYHVKGDVLEISSSPSLYPVSGPSGSGGSLDHLKIKIHGELELTELMAILRTVEESFKTGKEQQKHQTKDGANDEPKIVAEEMPDETARLAALFPGLDSNPEIVAIKAMLERGVIHNERAPPRFFDGLFYVMERNWRKCVDVFKIHLELVPEEKYDQNIFRVSGVLNELILRSTLQSLTLKHFPRDILIDSLATLQKSEELDYVDVSHNSLKLSGVRYVLRLLPEDPIDPIEINFEHNDILDDDEDRVGLLFQFHPTNNLKSVRIADQGESRELDLARIRARVENESVELL